MILERNKSTIFNAKIRLDGFGERKYKQKLSVYIRKSLNKGINGKVINNLKFVDSKENLLIQLTDIIAGSIHRYYLKNKSDNNLYKDIINSKIEDEWVFK